MHFQDEPTPPGVREITAAWFEPVTEFDEDELLDEPPTRGLHREPETRRPHERALKRFGGVIATHELAAAGVDAMSLRYLVARRELVRLRKGWFSLPGLTSDVALAWRIGGPLACVSALMHHGLVTAADGPLGHELHVALRTNTSRMPGRLTVAEYPESAQGQLIVRHWSTPSYFSGDRLAVSVDAALEQARHCRPLLARRARARERANGDAADP